MLTYKTDISQDLRLERRLRKASARDWKQQHLARLAEMFKDGVISVQEYAKHVSLGGK